MTQTTDEIVIESFEYAEHIAMTLQEHNFILPEEVNEMIAFIQSG